MLGLQQAGRTCTDGRQWYVCTAGPYIGCCSVGPCTDGVCPDEDSTTTTKKVTTTPTTSKSISTTLSTTETTTAVEESTSSSSSKTTSDAASSTASILSTSASISSTTSPTTSAESATILTSAISAGQTAVSTSSIHHRNAGMIGGVVGTVIAAILLALFLYFCIKRRRAQITITMHRSVPTQSLRAQDQTPSKKGPSSSATALVATAKESPHSAVSASPTSKKEASMSSLGNEIYNDYQSGPPSTLSSLTLSTLSNSNGPPTPPSKSSTSLALLIIPTESPQPHPHHSLTPRVPELSDTGFRHQRAELPAQPQSELINQQWNNLNANSSLAVSDQYPHGGLRKVEISEYTGRSFHHRQDGVQNSGTDLISRNTARKIVTRDGVVMGANLDRMSSIDEVDFETPSPTPTATPLSPRMKFSGRCKKSSCSGTPISKSAGSGPGSSASTPNQHVMSFMEYDAPSEMLELRGGEGRMEVHPALQGLGLGLSVGGPDSESGRRNLKVQAERDASRALDARDHGVEMDVLSEGLVGSGISGVSEILPAYESGGFYESQDRRESSGWKKIKEDG
ncbi:unnamed protein product [Penicillium pancosmium]